MKIRLLFIVFILPLMLYAQSTTPAWISTQIDSGVQAVVLGLDVANDGSNYTMWMVGDTNQAPPCDQFYLLVKYDAQGQLVWEDTLCAGYYQRYNKMVLDPYGFLYIAGVSEPVAYNGEFLVTRISPQGGIVWRNTYLCPTSFLSTLYDIHVDATGNLYLSGESPSIEKAVMMKCDTSGTLQWASSYNHLTGPYDRGWCITSDSYGHAYVGISSQDSLYDNEFVIAKYSLSGQFLWECRFSQFQWQGPVCIEVYNDTSIIATGWRSDTLSNGNVVTIKCDSAGNLKWWREFDADAYYGLPWTRDDEPKDMLITSSGKIAITVEAHNNGMPQWINMMYDNSGNLLWAAKDSNLCFPTTIRQDADGHIMAAALEQDLAGLGGIGVLKYDTLGNLLWHAIADTAGGAFVRMDLDSAGNIYCAGYSQDLFPSSAYHFTTLKYDYTVQVNEIVNSNQPQVYPNPGNNTVTFFFGDHFGSRTVEITDLSGRIVWQTTTSAQTVVFNSAQFLSGLYIYTVRQNGSVTSGKLVIEH